MKAELERALAGFARHHLGVVPRAHLRDLDVSPRQIGYLQSTGRLEPLYRSVYRVAGAPSSPRQQLLAACWAGGVRSYAGYRAAAEMWGLPGGAEICEITSPRWRRARHEGVITHESHHLSAIDFTVVDGVIPVTRPARTILDLCALAERGHMPVETVELAMQEAARRNLVDIGLIGARWRALGGVRRPGGLIAERLIDRWLPNAARTDSRAENVLLRLLSDAGLPDPVPQYVVWLGPNEHVRIDFAWPDVRAGLEFDSYEFHGGYKKYNASARRALRLKNRGWDLVTVTDDELDEGCPNALVRLRQVLGRAA
jgi:hypothetical protein